MNKKINIFFWINRTIEVAAADTNEEITAIDETDREHVLVHVQDQNQDRADAQATNTIDDVIRLAKVDRVVERVAVVDRDDVAATIINLQKETIILGLSQKVDHAQNQEIVGIANQTKMIRVQRMQLRNRLGPLTCSIQMALMAMVQLYRVSLKLIMIMKTI